MVILYKNIEKKVNGTPKGTGLRRRKTTSEVRVLTIIWSLNQVRGSFLVLEEMVLLLPFQERMGTLLQL